MIIGTIVDGIVIDHIPAGRAMDLYRDLGLYEANKYRLNRYFFGIAES